MDVPRFAEPDMNDAYNYNRLKGQSGQILLAGMLLLALTWCIDAAVDTIILGEQSFIREIISPSARAVWERLFTIALVTAFIMYVQYITAGRKRLAEELYVSMMKAREEKARAEGILAAIGDGVSIQDTDFRILYQNEIHKQFVGGDFVGQYCYTAYSCQDRVCPECPIANCFRDGTIHKVQKAAAPQMAATHIEITASPLFDANGRIIAGIELLRDISLSRQAEAELRNSELRFRNLVESTSDWVWEVDANGVYTYASPQIRKLLGYEPAEMIGKTPFDFMPQEEALRVAEIFGALVPDYKPILAIENINLHKEGYPVVLETSGVPFFGKDGVLCGYRGIDRDITERKQTENKIRELNEKLALRAAQLAAANRELEAFSSSVSHDLRTPLTRIYSAGQILKDSCSAEMEGHGPLLLNTICDACENMEELIDALLSLSRLSSGELHCSECDLSYIAQIVAAELQLANPSRRVEFTIEQGLVAQADQRLIKVLLENLIGNAWKYTQKVAETRIEFGAMQVGDETVYFVRDNGAGFDMGGIGKLFKPFQRLHDSGEFKGTGIGLATVQRIVARHGGRVWGEGETGRGATFYFTLK